MLLLNMLFKMLLKMLFKMLLKMLLAINNACRPNTALVIDPLAKFVHFVSRCGNRARDESDPY